MYSLLNSSQHANESGGSMPKKYRLGFVEYYLKKFAAKEQRILELGCGMGQYRDCTPACYVGLDVTSRDYKEGCPRIVDIVASGTAIPAREQSYDLVFSVGALYQMPEPLKVLSDSYRLLTPEGRGLFAEYNRRTLNRLEIEEGVKRPNWTPRRLKYLLQQAGFRNCEVLPPLSREVKQPAKSLRLLLEELVGQWAIVTGVK
jgi:ubiquinone/menaquinone biosynthesis C-methylase UbiE